MKQLFFLLSFCLMALSVNAQLFDARIEINYSNASIHGMSEETFAEYEKDWYKDKPQIQTLIIDGIMDEAESYLLLNKDANNSIQIDVTRITKNGGIDCVVTCYSNGTPLFKYNAQCTKGGTYGTKLNLIKDGAKKIGKTIGKILAKELNKRK